MDTYLTLWKERMPYANKQCNFNMLGTLSKPIKSAILALFIGVGHKLTLLF
jgi:hypothetical protein